VPFPVQAPLYSTNDEVGRGLIVFGRGTQRGDPVTVAGPLGPESKGWLWGSADGRMRWGQNQVASIAQGDDQTQPSGVGQVKIGELLQATFDLGGGTNEAHLSVGDSGGAVFIVEGTTWKLAGINYGVDGPYNLTNSGPGFEAALYDQGGLYTSSNANWTLTPDRPAAQPGAFYSTRVSAHVSWIQSVLAQVITESQLVLQSAPGIAGPYQDELDSLIDASSSSITVPLPQRPRFYRLRANAQLTITSVAVRGSQLLLRYLDPQAVKESLVRQRH